LKRIYWVYCQAVIYYIISGSLEQGPVADMTIATGFIFVKE
jgi:hypothetical protein